MYTKEDIEMINQIPITDILNNYGIEYKRKGNKAFCALRDGDKTPSCCLYLETNTWCDFGDANRGGTVVNLVQRIENIDWIDAAKKLADQWNIKTEKVSKTAFLSDYEFKYINIVPDRATKNFDFDIEKYGENKTAEFSTKYAISVYELENKYPKVYHNMLRSRAIPYLAEQRNNYYDSIFSSYHLAQELGSDELTEGTKADLELMAKSISHSENILQRAITRPDLLKFTTHKYNVMDDLAKILNGKIQIESGNQTYVDLKKMAEKQGEQLSYKEIPYTAWRTVHIHDSIPQEIPYAAFINAQNGTVNIVSFASNKAALNTALKLSPFPKEEKIKPLKQPDTTPKYNTVVVNLFGGPGAGKTGCAWQIAAELKKQGLVVEYVSEVAKEYVWDNDLKMLDGSVNSQRQLFEKQDYRVQRLMGKVEAVVTDSPILLNSIYLQEDSPDFKNEVYNRFSAQRNFNIFVKRGKQFEKEGRIHNQDQSIAIDEKIEALLKENDLFYGKYTYAQITQCVKNIQKTIAKANGKKFKDIAQQQNPIQQYCSKNYTVSAHIKNEIMR